MTYTIIGRSGTCSVKNKIEEIIFEGSQNRIKLDSTIERTTTAMISTSCNQMSESKKLSVDQSSPSNARASFWQKDSFNVEKGISEFDASPAP